MNITLKAEFTVLFTVFRSMSIVVHVAPLLYVSKPCVKILFLSKVNVASQAVQRHPAVKPFGGEEEWAS